MQTGCSSSTPTNGASEDSQPFRHVKVQAGSASAAAAIADHVKSAQSLQLKPFVYFSASWCPPCNAIKDSMDDPRMIDAFTGTYIIEFDVDEWQDVPEGFRTSTVPIYYEVDATGAPTGRWISGGAWGENIPENMAPPLTEFFHTS